MPEYEMTEIEINQWVSKFIEAGSRDLTDAGIKKAFSGCVGTLDPRWYDDLRRAVYDAWWNGRG